MFVKVLMEAYIQRHRICGLDVYVLAFDKSLMRCAFFLSFELQARVPLLRPGQVALT